MDLMETPALTVLEVVGGTSRDPVRRSLFGNTRREPSEVAVDCQMVLGVQKGVQIA